MCCHAHTQTIKHAKSIFAECKHSAKIPTFTVLHYNYASHWMHGSKAKNLWGKDLFKLIIENIALKV